MKLLCCLTLALAVPLVAVAQESPSLSPSPSLWLSPGTRVRVISPHGRSFRNVVGALESIDRNSIVVRRQNGTYARLPRMASTRLAVSQGPGACSNGRRGGCVVVGLLAGGVLGAGAGAIQASSCRGKAYCGLVYLVTVPVGALLGTAVGAIIGGERWRAAEPPVHLTITPGIAGSATSWPAAQLGVRIAF